MLISYAKAQARRTQPRVNWVITNHVIHRSISLRQAGQLTPRTTMQCCKISLTTWCVKNRERGRGERESEGKPVWESGKHDVCNVAPKARHDAAQPRATGKSPFLSDFLSSPSPMRVFPRFYPCGSTSNSLPTICRCKRLIAPSNHLQPADTLSANGSLRSLAPFCPVGLPTYRAGRRTSRV